MEEKIRENQIQISIYSFVLGLCVVAYIQCMITAWYQPYYFICVLFLWFVSNNFVKKFKRQISISKTSEHLVMLLIKNLDIYSDDIKKEVGEK